MAAKLIFFIRRKICVFLFLLFTMTVFSQNPDMKISDNINLIIGENTYLKIPGDLTIGNGTSGITKMNGLQLNVTGNFTLNSNSEFIYTQGMLNAGNILLNDNSTVTYNGDAQTVENWSYGILQLNGTGKMLISGVTANPTICKTLTINNSGNSLNIPEGKALTVENILNNNAGTQGLVVNSSASGDGSLISNSADCNASVQRYIKGNRWHYISPSANSVPLNIFNTNNFLYWDASVEWSGAGDYNPWKSYSQQYLNVGEGYAYYYYEDTISFEGFLNVSDYNITLYNSGSGNSNYQGWNLIGNPYSSVLDWDVAVSDGAVPAGAENAIYFFDDDNSNGGQSNYRYYVPSSGGTYGVGTNDATGSIPMGQGFFIKTNTDNVTLSLKKDYRVHENQEFYKSYEAEIIRLKINNTIEDETVLRVVENAGYNFDSQYDARKLFPNNELLSQIFMIDNQNNYTAISSVPKITENSIFRIGFYAEKGSCKISAGNFNINQDFVYLVDSYKGIFWDLKTNGIYEFDHSGGMDLERFYLAFQNQTSNTNEIFATSISVFPNPSKGIINIQNNSGYNFKSIRVNTIDGKVCKEFTENRNKIDLSQLNNGIYHMVFLLENGKISYQKIIINK